MTTTPLTPAQIEWLTQWFADWRGEIHAEVEQIMADALSPLQAQVDALQAQVATIQEALTVLDGAALKVGDPIALRAASGKLVCAEEGGPKIDEDPFTFVARSTVGAWESFGTERGQR